MLHICWKIIINLNYPLDQCFWLPGLMSPPLVYLWNWVSFVCCILAGIKDNPECQTPALPQRLRTWQQTFSKKHENKSRPVKGWSSMSWRAFIITLNSFLVFSLLAALIGVLNLWDLKIISMFVTLCHNNIGEVDPCYNHFHCYSLPVSRQILTRLQMIIKIVTGCPPLLLSTQIVECILKAWHPR